MECKFFFHWWVLEFSYPLIHSRDLSYPLEGHSQMFWGWCMMEYCRMFFRLAAHEDRFVVFFIQSFGCVLERKHGIPFSLNLCFWGSGMGLENRVWVVFKSHNPRNLVMIRAMAMLNPGCSGSLQKLEISRDSSMRWSIALKPETLNPNSTLKLPVIVSFFYEMLTGP